jgi:murein DD-endopeptidase MepM/ murein hydrolase activator NlpD
MRKFAVLLVVLLLAAVGLYVAGGRLPGASIQIVQPEQFAGSNTPVRVTIGALPAALSSVDVVVEQDGRSTPLVSTSGGAGNAAVTADGAAATRVDTRISPETVPGLHSGPARLVVTATRPVLRGLRRITTTASRELQVRLEPPTVSVLSSQHYIKVGGAELVVYRVAPADVSSGVRVGEIEYPGYPATGVHADGVSITDPAVRVAFFALGWDQPLDTPIDVFARDAAGNTAQVALEHRTFPSPARSSRIAITDAFLQRVVPAILASTKEVAPTGSLVDQFLVINGDLRKRNAATIASFAAHTAPEMLWGGVAFHPFTNSAAESAFADRRTYVYDGREIDHQVHLGFDLASYAHTPVVAANRGRVLYAAELGIYGNCVILDHGMGVQSLYGHMSSLQVKPGDVVDKGQTLGLSGMTGLAGGDHLHFTMLVNGQMVTPLEWWDAHWIQDRILRKLRAVD